MARLDDLLVSAAAERLEQLRALGDRWKGDVK